MNLIDIRRDLHKIPELGFQEFKTQQYILNFLSQLPQEHLTITTWKTGVIVSIRGKEGNKTIGWRTDIDGLPITEETGLDFKSLHEGQMHACGHDCHMAIALGLVSNFSKNPPAQNVHIYFQPAEEGPGGAEPMLNWLKKERKDLLCNEIYALHIAPELPVGTVSTRAGLLFANTSELFIDLKGLGGHAAYPHKTKDMTVAMANLILQLQTIVSRNINPLDSAVVTIGKVTAGTVQNIIAENARVEGTIRTLSAETMQQVKKRIEAICKGIEASFECEISIDYGSMYYEVRNHEGCAEELLQFAEEFHSTNANECTEAMTGEDFGYFLKEIPGAMYWAGAGCEYGLHHSRLTPDERLIKLNVEFVEAFIRQK